MLVWLSADLLKLSAIIRLSNDIWHSFEAFGDLEINSSNIISHFLRVLVHDHYILRMLSFFLKYCSLDNKQKQWINWPSMTNKSSFQETDSFKSKSNRKKDCSMHCLSLRFLCWCRQLVLYVVAIDHSYKLFISLEIYLKFINIKINVSSMFLL